MTTGCSAALKWKECGNAKAYYRMKCDGMKARFYPWLVNNEELDDCMINVSRNMPLFKEMQEACEIAFSARSVTIGILSILTLGMLIM